MSDQETVQNLGEVRPALPSNPNPVAAPESDAGGSTLASQPPLNSRPPVLTQPTAGKGESQRAFEAFQAYLGLGSQRRYAAAARKVGASLRTVKRWAIDFDWRGRIKTYAAERAEHYARTADTVHREELVDAAARAKAFRDRQYDLAEAILDAAERYLEGVDPDDLDQMSFPDACKALEVASRFGQQAAAARATDAASAPAHNLRDQLTALLDQAYRDTPPPSPLDPARRSSSSPCPSDGRGIQGEGAVGEGSGGKGAVVEQSPYV